MTRLLIADGQLLFAESLAVALEGQGTEPLHGHPNTGFQALRAVIDQRPDVALVDYWIEGMKGPAVARFIAKRQPLTKVILMSGFFTSREISEAGYSGAFALVPKTFQIGQLKQAVMEASAADPIGPLPATKRPESGGDEIWERLLGLTLRELEIMTMLETHTAKEISAQLSLSLPTVRTHINNILNKMGARTQREAVDLARSHGLA